MISPCRPGIDGQTYTICRLSFDSGVFEGRALGSRPQLEKTARIHTLEPLPGLLYEMPCLSHEFYLLDIATPGFDGAVVDVA
jgi:hypothetical protein